MSANVAPTQVSLFTSLRALILTLIDCEVVQGLGNGVPTPLGGFITITELSKIRLATNTHIYADPTPTTGTTAAQQAMQVTVQIDCYGPESSDWAAILATMLRDEYACDLLAPVAQPLHADDPKMAPMINGEDQYDQRWMITAVLQVNPVVSLPMQFFEAVDLNLIEVDATYPA